MVYREGSAAELQLMQRPGSIAATVCFIIASRVASFQLVRRVHQVYLRMLGKLQIAVELADCAVPASECMFR
jgi:hypothetical protein